MLATYGGIVVDIAGPGVEVAREPFRLDPIVAEGEGDRFAAFSRFLGSDLVPIGEVEQGRVFLAVAADGRIYGLMDSLWFVGENIEDALNGLVMGRRWQLLTGTVAW